jgi:FkbM family methyltransferase
MRIRDREPRRILAAPFKPRTWLTLGRMALTYRRPAAALRRYVSNADHDYPWDVTLRTPLGDVTLPLESRHDLLTVNEIFCRRDYGSGSSGVIVDIGANIGIASVFFLTRNRRCRVWAFEPDPANVARLRQTLAAFRDRVTIHEAAITPDERGTVTFVPRGRYGHVAGADEEGITVRAISIKSVVKMVSDAVGRADLMKIDVEGLESELVAAIPAQDAPREVRYEMPDGVKALRFE